MAFVLKDQRKRMCRFLLWSQAGPSPIRAGIFFVPLHANVFVEASICRLVSRFTYGTQNYCQSDWSFLFLPSLF